MVQTRMRRFVAAPPRAASMSEAWRCFAERVIPLGASPIQRQEMRRAFYAGAECLLGCLQATLPPDGATVDAEVTARLIGEIEGFFREVMQGRA